MEEDCKSVDAEYYKKVLQQLMRVHIPQKRPQYANDRWKLHHDNARPHVSHLMAKHLARLGVRVVPHTPYRPDLAPCDFFLNARLKKNLKGRRFESRNAIIGAVQAILKKPPLNAF